MNSTLSLLRKKDFLFLMMGKLVSLLGSNIQSFALSLYVLKITGSATKFASVLGIAIIPRLVLSPIAGVIADWFDRKQIIVCSDLFSGLLIGVYAVIYKLNSGLSIESIYVLVIISTIISVFFNPAINAVIPSIVKKEELVDANSIDSFIANTTNFVSPMIAAALLGIFDIFIILIINSLSFILSAIQEMFISIPKTNKKPHKITFKAFLSDFVTGFNFIRFDKLLPKLIILGLIANFIFTPILFMGITYISKEIFMVSDYQYSFVESIIVLATLISPIVSNILCKKFEFSKIFYMYLLLTSILGVVLAVSCSPLFMSGFGSILIPFSVFVFTVSMMMLIISVGNMAFAVMQQQIIPINMMGRVKSTINSCALAMNPISYMIYGFLFDKYPVWISVVLSSILLFLVVISFKKILYISNSNEKEDKFSYATTKL